MSEPTPQSKKQKLWPLFVLGLALTAFGFYFAFAGGGEVEVGATARGDYADTSLEVPSGLERTPAAHLTIAPEKLENDVVYTQTQISSVNGQARTIETRVKMRIVDLPLEAPRTYSRRYQDVEIEVLEDGKLMPNPVAGQVSRLIETVEHEVEFESLGRIKRIDLRSNPSGELAQFLSVVQDAAVLLSPQFPREPVNVDEPWVYNSPLYASGGENKTIEGDIQFSNTFRGWLNDDGRKIAVVEQNISGQAEGSNLSGHGIGKAIFFVDTQGAFVRQADLQFEQVSGFGGGASVPVQSTTVLKSSARIP